MKYYTCIYCMETKSKDEFHTEHVIPQAFGKFGANNLTLNDSVCAGCNNYFGRTIEQVFGRETFEALQRPDYNLKTAPKMAEDFVRGCIAIRLHEESDWKGAFLRPVNEKEKIAYEPIPQIGFAHRPDSSCSYMTEPDVYWARAFPQYFDFHKGLRVLARTDRDIERLRRLLWRKGISFKKKGEPPLPAGKDGQILIQGEYVIDKQVQRCVAKICFDYLAWVSGAKFLLHRDFDQIRRFVRYGDPPSYRFFYPSQNPILRGDEKIKRQTDDHLLVIDWEDRSESIVVRLSLFNILTYQVVIARNFSGVWCESFRCGHRFSLSDKKVYPLGKDVRRVLNLVVLSPRGRLVHVRRDLGSPF